AKSPADRYDDAADFADDLRRLANHRTPLAAQHRTNPYDPTPHQTDPSDVATTVMPAAGAAGVAGATAANGAHSAATPGAHAAQPGQSNAPGQAQGAHAAVAPAEGDTAPRNTGGKHSTKHSEQGKNKRSALSTWTRIIWTLVILAVLGIGGAVAWSYYHDNTTSSSLPHVDNNENKKISIPDVTN
ncbi:serine/threonine protein kinase, partial [Klebsiella pneumoniae]